MYKEQAHLVKHLAFVSKVNYQIIDAVVKIY